MKERMERFDKYMKYKGLNDNQVTNKCGLSKGLIGQARTGKSDLGIKAIDKILIIYQDLNRVWLLTGEGEMIKNNLTPQQYYGGDTEKQKAGEPQMYIVSLIPISAKGGTLDEFSRGIMENDCEKVLSPIKGADFAITVCGDSMSPDYPSGCHIFIKKIEERAFIDWGKVFVLDTVNGTIIKKLMPVADDPSKIKCISINPEYPPYEISLEYVRGIYRVLMCMALK